MLAGGERGRGVRLWLRGELLELTLRFLGKASVWWGPREYVGYMRITAQRKRP